MVFLSYNLTAGNVMKKIMISLDMTFMSEKNLNCYTYNSRYNVYARKIFRKKLKSLSITQDIMVILC
jgi:hypothetical protein